MLILTDESLRCSLIWGSGLFIPPSFHDFFFPLLRDFIVVLLQHHSKKDLQTPGLYPVSPQQKHDPLEHIPIPSQTFSQDKYVLEFF